MIVVCEKRKPPQEWIPKMFLENKDGASIATRETNGKGKIEVVWKKGLELLEIQDEIEKAVLPFVVHFRKQTVGGNWYELCHPFPIDKKSSTAREGRTTGSVLFHNGTWTGWEDVILRTCYTFGVEIPEGKWSDTRAIAWLSTFYGKHFLNLINAKGIVFSPTEITMAWGPDGWVRRDDVWVSNVRWEHAQDNRPMCKYGSCQNKDTDSDTRCRLHPKKEYPFSTVAETLANRKLGAKDDTTSVDDADRVRTGSIGPVALPHAKPVASSGPGGAREYPTPFAVVSAEVSRQSKLGWVTKKQYSKLERLFQAVLRNLERTKPGPQDPQKTTVTPPQPSFFLTKH